MGWAVIDDDMVAELSKHKWRCNKGYACRGTRSGGRKGPYVHIQMHDVVLPGHPLVDHINRQASDNRRENLRPATRRLNRLNSKLNQNNHSGERNVHWHKANQKWIAQVCIDYERHYIGSFKEKADAVKAVENRMKEQARKEIS